MKKIFYKTGLVVLLMGLFTSCEDELNQLPFDEYATDIAYVSAEDFENGIRGSYIALTDPGYYGSSDAGSLLSFPDVLTDNVIMTQRGRRTKRTLHEFTYTPATIMSGFYINCYNVVYGANQVLFYLDANNFEGENRTNLEAEARALRAMAHFDLVRTYGKIPTQSSDANSSLGVAYVTEPDPLILPERLTVAQTYDRIIEDLTFAADNINASNGVARLNRESVYLLLSRVYLYMGEWQKAIDAANNVTTSVAARDNVPGVWTDQNQDGLLFHITNEQGAGQLDLSIGVTWGQGGVSNNVPEYAVAFSFFNEFSDDDIRKEAYIHTVQGGGDSFNGIKKLFGKVEGETQQFNGIVDFKILRAAEAHLNKAEAYYELDQGTSALTALDELRNERYTSFTGGETGTALRDAIRQERRLEFAFEYQRFFDLKRWGLGVQRDGQGEFADGSGTPSDVQTLEAGNFRFQLPLPQQATVFNPNLDQNPGYGN